MSKKDLLERYAIPMRVDGEALAGVVYVYETLIQSLSAQTVTTAKFESQVRETFAKQTMSVELSDLLSEIATTVWAFVDSGDCEISDLVHLFDWLGDFRTTVKDERDYRVRAYARENKPRTVTGDDYEAKKQDAIDLRNHADAMLASLLMVDADIPATVSTKTMKDKTVKVNVSDLPKGATAGAGNGGRKVATHNLRLVVDGEVYDTVSVSTVCHDVLSSGPNRVTITSFIEAVKAAGLNDKFSNGWGEDEALTINGHKVWAIERKSEVTADEQAEDEAEEESDETETVE